MKYTERDGFINGLNLVMKELSDYIGRHMPEKELTAHEKSYVLGIASSVNAKRYNLMEHFEGIPLTFETNARKMEHKTNMELRLVKALGILQDVKYAVTHDKAIDVERLKKILKELGADN